MGTRNSEGAARRRTPTAASNRRAVTIRPSTGSRARSGGRPSPAETKVPPPPPQTRQRRLRHVQDEGDDAEEDEGGAVGGEDGRGDRGETPPRGNRRGQHRRPEENLNDPDGQRQRRWSE